MAEAPKHSDITGIPEAVVAAKSRWSLQIVWLIPLVAALIGGWLVVKTIMERGPTITISFKTAEGLEAGKTKIRYKDVEIGLVKTITLAPDLGKVIATAELVKEFSPNLVNDTNFWVVRARISGGTVSGLGTLLSGSYIGVEVGKGDKSKREYVGLEEPPVISINSPGREFILRSNSAGSLSIGTPIFYRQIQAGQITHYELDPDGKGITIKTFINAPFDKFVNDDTRFWNASGFDVKLDASGIKIDTQSLVSILVGGIAFESPMESADLPPAPAQTRFMLAADRTQAMKNSEGEAVKYVMKFRESVRGLEPGAPIDFLGIVIGEVVSIRADFENSTQRLILPVEVNIYPDRLRARSVKQREKVNAAQRAAFIKGMTERGLRAQLRTGNLLTGQLYIALDFFPNAPKFSAELTGGMPELPTFPSSIKELQATITSLASKFEKLPLEQISNDLRQTLQTGNRLLQNIDSELLPEARTALIDSRKALAAAERVLSSDSSLQQDAREAMREIARTAQAFRVFADYLERHPEALIRGKQEEEK